MLVKDQLNRVISFQKAPERIVSLVPSQTELLVDLQLKSKLVGITKFCVHPANLRKEVTIVGGTKKVRFRDIEALKPDIIICNKEENSEEIVTACSQIAPTWVSDIYSFEDSIEMIRSLGKIFNVSENASEIVAGIRFEKEFFSEFIKEKPQKKVAYLIWKNPFMAAGRNTFINTLLQLNNFENILTESTSRYPEINLPKLESAELVLLSSEPYPFSEKDINELKKVLPGKVILVDGEYFSWYGSRLLNAFSYFKTLH
jgi:ABC-type Fe3+-hydroxamate transport system substrate-binding protein